MKKSFLISVLFLLYFTGGCAFKIGSTSKNQDNLVYKKIEIQNKNKVWSPRNMTVILSINKIITFNETGNEIMISYSKFIKKTLKKAIRRDDNIFLNVTIKEGLYRVYAVTHFPDGF